MKKLDLKKELKPFFSGSKKKPQIIDIPEFKYLMIDGKIEPGKQPNDSPSFQGAIKAIYGVAFTIKFDSKLRENDPVDYPVMSLEGLWWTEDGEFDINRADEWSWTLMIMQPEHITGEMFREAVKKQSEKHPSEFLENLRLEKFKEGLCVQMLHQGPYSTESETLEKMFTFIREQGYKVSGKHHEIYLGDPRRAKPENLRTLLRLPVERITG